MKPATQYTKSGRINIAYQVFGAGPVDLVYIPGWVSNIDWMWACPELVDFLLELGKICRVILFDKRGTGLSDRVVELSTLEERMDDIRAVMDAVGSERAILFGHSEGGCVSALYAATYPDRVVSLITFGIFAKRRYSPDYPWAPTDEERQEVYDMIENCWGSGDMNLESLAPSKANDRQFMDWLANYFRSGASPSAAMVLTKMNTQVDIIDILKTIKVPTLMMQRTYDVDVKIEEGRFIAERIKGSKFIELDGSDHLFWAGNTQEVLEHMKSFILNVEPIDHFDERLFTIVAAKINSSNPAKEDTQDTINKLVVQYRGKLIQHNKESFTAIFEGPSKAVHCSMELISKVDRLNAQLSIGIHIKAGILNDSIFISTEDNDDSESILEFAEQGKILITQPVKYLLSGAGLNLKPYKNIEQIGSGEPLSLYVVTDNLLTGEVLLNINQKQSLQNDSFLENVLQCIDTHLSNEDFGVEMLCKEMGISERQIQRKIKAISNKSPNQLITSVRLHRAKELMLGREDNISEIAYSTGFANPSYFSKCFRKEFGVTPSTFLQSQP